MSLLFDHNHELIKNRIHNCSAEVFINTFCVDPVRIEYKETLFNILDYAKHKGARRIIVGGSFISSSKNPSDFDCVIVFHKAGDIPGFVDTTVVGNIEFDILFASEDQSQILDSFIDLFQTYKNGLKGKPVVEILLDDALQPWVVTFIPDDNQAEVIRKVYSKRSIIERRKSRGVLFSIHGVNTKAYWNSKLAPLASSQGWIFAPFIYENPVTLLASPYKRKKVLQDFSSYYHDVVTRYDATSTSIIAHSFGTYIIAKYLVNSEYKNFLTCQIDSIVLTGAIVDNNFDWKKYYPNKIGCVLNISSKNDAAVRWMPDCKFLKRKILRDKDDIFGRIGYTGLSTNNSNNGFITNLEIEVVNHCHVFKDEILTGVIMPFLNANVDICSRKYTQEGKH